MMSIVPVEPTPAAGHVTVMPAEAVRALDPRDGQLILDVTVGGGGHSLALLEACPSVRLLCFDRDPAAVVAARARLASHSDRALVARAAFDELDDWLDQQAIAQVDGVLADLGISSLQLDDPARGMTFRFEGPLDMRMDPDRGESALELVARLSQDELADLIYQYGEERRSRRVARCIKQALGAGRLQTTVDLRRAVVQAVGPRRVGGVDPATRTFQALRIAVNGELAQLECLLAFAARRVRPGGTAVCISFHSLEDRLVKRAFAARDLWDRLSAKPLVPSELERARNPRARSAKLRAARRLSGVESGGSP